MASATPSNTLGTYGSSARTPVTGLQALSWAPGQKAPTPTYVLNSTTNNTITVTTGTTGAASAPSLHWGTWVVIGAFILGVGWIYDRRRHGRR